MNSPVELHAMRIVVWDVPSAVALGETFGFKVGLKCSCACQLAGKAFAIYDGDGRHVASGQVGVDPWPGSTGLHFAEVEVAAPGVEGLHQWQIRVPASTVKPPESDIEIPHDQHSDTFAVRCVPAPEFVVKVQVLDNEARTSLQGASVVMYPYRAVTDERGIAEIKAAKGEYRLLVSRSKYLASGCSIVVTGNVTTTAVLDPQPVINSDDRYFS